MNKESSKNQNENFQKDYNLNREKRSAPPEQRKRSKDILSVGMFSGEESEMSVQNTNLNSNEDFSPNPNKN